MRKVPKLRFKEFSNEWEEKKLGEISEVIKQKADEINDFPILTISAGKGFINQEDRFSKIIAGKSLEKYTLLKKNEFSYNRGNSKQYKYGCIYKLNNYEIALVPNVYRSFKLNKENPEFYFQLFQKKYLDNQLKKIISSSARMDGLLNISEKDFFDVKVPLTLLKEQEKIANFLSSIDKKISLTEEKLELFREYKKGVMQKIFSQELRFKDSNGNDYPEWEEKKLGEIAFFSKGKLISKEDITEEGVECIRYGELYTIYKEKIEKVVSKTKLEKNKLILSEKNDVIIPSSGETAIDIAVASCVMKDGVALGADLNIIKTKENGLYLAYFINNPAKLELASLAQGASVIHLYEKHLKLLNIKIPTLEEQEKIADFLSSIDSKIESIEKELEGLKEFKKGLLQQMFI